MSSFGAPSALRPEPRRQKLQQAVSPAPGSIDLERALAPVARRVRLVRALRALALYALFGALLASVAGALTALGVLDELDRTRAQLGGVLLALWGFVLGWMRVPSRMEVALLVDATHPLGGRIAAGAELATLTAPTAMERLAIEDALAQTGRIDPRRAVPLRTPRFLQTAGLAVGLAIATLLIGPPVHEIAVATAPTRRLRPLVVHEDDLAVLRDRVAELPERRRTPEVRAEIDALNRIIEDLSNHDVERTEALRRLGEIAEGLRSARPGALDATLETLERLAQPLSRSPLSESIGEALGERDLATAAEEMERLAERIERDPPSRAELERLREAMAAAARETNPESLRREREALEEQRDRLLRREEEESAMSETERAERESERERELERLRRDIEERTERERELDELRRELEEALGEREEETEEEGAESEGGSGLERAAEDLQRFADEASGESEREELAREVEALREMIRRMREGGSGESGESGEGGESESPSSGESGESRMDRFVLRARGSSGAGEEDGMPIGVPGGGEEGEGESEGSGGEGGAEGERAESAPGSGGDGSEGEGSSGGGGEMLMLGSGEDRLELPGLGGAGHGEEHGPESGSEGTAESEGSGHGTGAGGGSLEDPTGRLGEHTTVRVAGEEGRGPSRSEVIRTSAARGFASREYRDVYGDYREHAEEALEEEEIPPGYRFYVERYFQLIRPRE